MAIPVIMPRQGQSVESCIITEWKKQVGDTVKEGDILFSYETDKSAFEEPAKADGTLLAVFFHEDDDVPCLTNVAVIGAPGESYVEFAPGGAASAVKAETETEKPSLAAQGSPTAAPRTAERAAGVSPRARRTAERMSLDPAMAAPTGPAGRVIERDILSLAGGRSGEAPLKTAAAPTAGPASDIAEYDDIRMPNLRRVIARTMHESLTSMAQLTHNTSYDASNVLSLRAQLKATAAQYGLPNISINDILLFAVSRVLMKHEALNAHCIGDTTIRYFRHVNLGVAVDTPRGLLVPTLFHADEKSLSEIASEAKALASAAQEGSISPDLLTGGSFTVSNLGSFGIESFTPVINPPQVAILGVDCVTERVRSVNGQLTSYPAMGLSLTYDHRAVDGAPASRFLQELAGALTNIDALLVK